ncbi:hypothetical protein [Gemmatimonas sp.]|uniref:hypothetical protein n=1 Tax=Gemmatimonas sp. TaxID=1962908 RepID=UPI0035616DBA
MTTPERRAARAGMPVRIYRLGHEPPDTWLACPTAAERLEMVADLSERMFEIAGRPAPSYTRATMPIRVARLA